MAQNHHQHHQDNNTKNLLECSLYCSEEHWEEEQENDDEYGNNYTNTLTTPNSPLLLPEQDMFCDNEELASLLNKEQHNKLCNYLEESTEVLDLARGKAVGWIMRVNAHYSFSALTAVLAVNYFDRFLFSFRFEIDEKPWLTQLAAVACLSLAAKVEETHVPLLVDLQVEESRYLFEAKTIKRMEILVLSTLGWKMNPVTPISFLDYIIRRLGLKGCLGWEFLRRCEVVVLSVFADSRFLRYLPSVLATATMMNVFNSVEPGLGVEYQNQLLGILGINKDKVEECYNLIMKHVSCGYDDDHGKQSNNKRKFGCIIPSSPNGVMDVSFSCDSSNDSWEVATTTSSVSSSPEQPLSKKTRTTATTEPLLLN